MSQRRLSSSISQRPSKVLKQRTLSKSSAPSSTGRTIEKRRNLSQTSNQISGDKKSRSRTSSILDRTKLTPPQSRNKKRPTRNSLGKKGISEQDTEKQKQMLIEKLLESKMVDDDPYSSQNMKLSFSPSRAKESSNSPSPKKRSLSAFSTDYRPPSVKPSIFLTREKDSKSDSSLQKEIIEETVHYFNTPSTSADELRPYSAPARDFKSLEDNGYARYLLDKIKNRALRFEPQMQKIRQASLSAYERSVFQKQQESPVMDGSEQKSVTSHSRVMSECNHMLPHLVSEEIVDSTEVVKLLPEWCIPEHHVHSIKEAVDNKSRTVSFKREHSAKKEGFKRTKGAGECCQGVATSKDWSHLEHQSRSSSFPNISTSSTGKATPTTVKAKPSTPFGPLYGSSEDDLANDLKNTKKLETESTHSLKEAWSMPAISTHAMATTDEESPTISSQEETMSLSSTSSHDSHRVARSGENGSLESSKETEDLRHYRRTPSRSASRSPRNKRPLEESKTFSSEGDFLPQVSGARRNTTSSSQVSSLSHKGSRRNTPRGEINTSGELTFTGTFNGTATMPGYRDVTEMFGYDFHVLPSTPSQSSSSNYDYKYDRKLLGRPSQKFLSSHDKHRASSSLEVEDLELPAVRATRPKTAVGSSRSVSTKQVAFEVSESDEPTSTNSNAEKSGRNSSIGSYQSGLAPLNYSRNSMGQEPESPCMTSHQRKNSSASQGQGLSLPHNCNSQCPASHIPYELEPKSSPKDKVDTGYTPAFYRGKADALSMPSRNYIEHYSQLQEWRQERIIRDVHREITRRYGKHIHFVHPSRDFMMGIFHKSVTKHWTFWDVFQEVEEYWIKPVLNWHRRLYIYSLVYPPHV